MLHSVWSAWIEIKGRCLMCPALSLVALRLECMD